MVTWRRRLKFRIHLGVAIGNHFNDKKNNENDVKVPNIYLLLNDLKESMIYEAKKNIAIYIFLSQIFQFKKCPIYFMNFPICKFICAKDL